MSKTETVERVVITKPNFRRISLRIRGTSPLMQNRFSKKGELMLKMEQGSTAKKGKKRDARDFERDFLEAQHFSEDGWVGMPAAAFRNACIDVCRVVGFKMTHAKMSVFIEAAGFDKEDGTPLVPIEGDAPERIDMVVRNQTGVVDVRTRPMWRKWSIPLVVKYDADQFTAQDVVNLLARAGEQVGIGEGRHFSKESNGIGFGCFEIEKESNS